ncbi:hypothetical protein H6G04_24270 [Calothrix membranacea FACHB-236]|nr:hypothetical protein [Calothrix membranacea FACHB-236]
MSNELFTAVSVEEQEIVAGGGTLASLESLSAVFSNTKAFGFTKTGPNNAESGAGFENTNLSLATLKGVLGII